MLSLSWSVGERVENVTRLGRLCFLRSISVWNMYFTTERKRGREGESERGEESVRRGDSEGEKGGD